MQWYEWYFNFRFLRSRTDNTLLRIQTNNVDKSNCDNNGNINNINTIETLQTTQPMQIVSPLPL